MVMEKYTVEQRKKRTEFPFYKFVARRYVSYDGKTFIPAEEYMARTKDIAMNKVEKWKRR